MDKRIVVVHPNGVHQIIGVEPGTLRTVLGDSPLTCVDLYRVTARAAFYRRPLYPTSRGRFNHSFDERQS